MIALRWLTFVAVVPLIVAAAPALAAHSTADTALGPLEGFIKSLFDTVSATFTSIGSLFTVTTYITPANGGGKRVKVTGARWPGGYNSFLGIPYAEAPAGTKRFDPPQPKVYTADSLSALAFGPACIQPASLAAGLSGQSEDCLSLNILTPSAVAGTSARLPVLVWLHGGSFITGTGSYYTVFQAAALSYAKSVGRPVVLVTLNYRLGVWGFGLGKEMHAAGAANAGLLDQRLALQWIRDHIAAFGGDPARVTAYGQSAGAGSIALHLLDERSEGLLAGGIMQSGAQDGEPVPRTEDYQAPYDRLCELAGCNGTASLECLRALPADALNKAQTALGEEPDYKFGLGSQIWRPSVDGAVIPDSPFRLLRAGNMANIPFITGTNRDDGTLFVDSGVQTQAEIPGMIDKLYPRPLGARLWDTIFSAYPNNASLGCPFDTGSDTFGKAVAYKQAAGIMNDVAFLAPKRNHLRCANEAGVQGTWSYLFEGPTPVVPKYLGLMHALDLPYVFGIVSPWLFVAGWTAKDRTMSQQMMQYWLNFAYNQDPNGDGLPSWPRHAYPANKNSLLFLPDQVGVIQDDFREERVAIFNDPANAAELYL
ncbi:hypothetical protein Q8F55_001093 [Vanrija albida]|uniref:Carboxylesterase type B domain-containing protein n=1 Tax=Vanrija albida TaxID=181172 RepID=A0ABR3QF54_9TREE